MKNGPRHTQDTLEARYWLTEKGIAATGGHRPGSSPEQTLAAVIQFHRAWGDLATDELDALALWEDLGRLIGEL